MSSRDEILKRLIRSVPVEKSTGYITKSDSGIYADYPLSESEQRKIFAERLQQLHGELITVKDETEAAGALYRIIEDMSAQSCLGYAPGLMEKLTAIKPEIASRLADNALLSGKSPEFSTYAAGITRADYLVARSGSIILSAATAGGRRLSVLPPVHIVLAYASQLVPSLDAVLKDIPDSSYVTIITGPSRTSDIEKKLVLGAHGPKRLVVILIG